jgi:hypothetical protein
MAGESPDGQPRSNRLHGQKTALAAICIRPLPSPWRCMTASVWPAADGMGDPASCRATDGGRGGEPGRGRGSRPQPRDRQGLPPIPPAPATTGGGAIESDRRCGPRSCSASRSACGSIRACNSQVRSATAMSLPSSTSPDVGEQSRSTWETIAVHIPRAHIATRETTARAGDRADDAN